MPLFTERLILRGYRGWGGPRKPRCVQAEPALAHLDVWDPAREEYWNQGYGTEATKEVIRYCFEVNALHRLGLLVYESNARAVALYKKLGFVEEGRVREMNWRAPGEWEDAISMGMLEKEYFARKKAEEAATL
ncbi:acyl-CoA N-acyltransferase [Schizophyllum amplum]|uniref:Acyl-CoA N-acyltransferase n=1 Tax=Schizophyllum amplum TaxID=97359 RepID=A0A550C1S8_9AGAR|nr:acyl-CoA N-acyltransferase [Auriculariopsis ampla]